MKKVLRLSAISASVLAASMMLSSTAFAANYKGDVGYKGEPPCPAPEKLGSGFYLGGQVGYDSYRVRENVSLAAGALSANPSLNATGFVGGLFLGYGQYFSDYYYLGGELLGNASNASSNWSANTSTLSYNSKFSVNGTWGLALLPGLKLNNTSLIYVRLGYNWTNLKAQESTATASTSKSNTSGGFAYGLGLESLITGAWSVRTEYSHTNYNSFSSSMGTSFSPSNNQYMVGLVYHFG